MANVGTGLQAGTVLGGYRIESFVARGGMGVVYKATQLALERTVALKLVAPELAHDEAFRARFKREALLAAALDHPNILPVYEAGEIDGQLFLAMRYVVGTDMETIISREHALSPDRAASIVSQVAGALDAAHQRGLVHRDVKPGNILIAEEYGEERAYLTDFGLTKNAATEAHLTRTGLMVGTLDYVAPEQAEGRPVDGRSDTYALACLMYRAVTGRVPFERPSDAAKLWAHLNDPPPSASEASPAVSSELDAVIRRGMAKRPEERYASSGEFARAVRRAAAAAVPAPLERTEVERTETDATIVEPLTPPTVPSPAARGRSATARPGPARVLATRRGTTYAGGAALLVVIGVIVAIAAGGGGGKGSTTAASVPAAASTPAAVTSTTSPTASTSTSTASAQAANYRAQVERIIPRMHAIFTRFPPGQDFGKPVFSAKALAVAASLRGIADNLDALSPPPQVLVDHEALVTELEAMEQEFRSLALDSDSRAFTGAHNDLQKVKASLSQINRSVRRVKATS